MRRAYKFRIYPTRRQKEHLTSMLESLCRLYNDLLARREAIEDQRYEVEKDESLSKEEKEAKLKELKAARSNKEARNFIRERRTEDQWLGRIAFHFEDSLLDRLEFAYKRFWDQYGKLKGKGLPHPEAKKKAGYPHPADRLRFNSMIGLSGLDDVKIVDGRKIKIAKFDGAIRVNFHRQIEGAIKTATIVKDINHWYVIFSCDLGDIKVPKSRKPMGAIHLGVDFIITEADRESEPSAIPLQSKIEELQRLSQALSRKQGKPPGERWKKGEKLPEHKRSKGWYAARHRLAKFHAKVARHRQDAHHKLANYLVNKYGVIAYLKPKTKEIIEESKNALPQIDAAWSNFLTILNYKAEAAGVDLVPYEINPDDPPPEHPYEAARYCLARLMAARRAGRESLGD